MQKVSVFMVCDMPHDEPNVEALRNVEITIEGRTVNVDLCAQHINELHEDTADYFERGTVTRKKRQPRRVAAGARQSGLSVVPKPSYDPKTVREWAHAQGIDVADKGRVPQAVVERYEMAVAH